MLIDIRLATQSDIEEAKSLFADTIKSTCKNDYNVEQINAWVSSVENKERWESLLKEQYFIIAQIEEEMVGFATLEDGCYLDFLYVHKDHLRKGIANLLYDNLKAEASRRGIQKLSSDVSITAQPFFESKGFKIIKENRNIRNGIELINYKMSQ